MSLLLSGEAKPPTGATEFVALESCRDIFFFKAWALEIRIFPVLEEKFCGHTKGLHITWEVTTMLGLANTCRPKNPNNYHAYESIHSFK